MVADGGAVCYQIEECDVPCDERSTISFLTGQKLFVMFMMYLDAPFYRSRQLSEVGQELQVVLT